VDVCSLRAALLAFINAFVVVTISAKKKKTINVLIFNDDS